MLVRASAREIGAEIRMAPALDGDLYVVIPQRGGSLLVLLGARGQVRPGWPVVLDGAADCQLLRVGDGSVRLLCWVPELNFELNVGRRAMAYDADGTPLDGWPVDLPWTHPALVVEADRLHVLEVATAIDVVPPEGDFIETRIVTIAADGTSTGRARWLWRGSTDSRSTLGPDRIGYTVRYPEEWIPPISTEVAAVDANGLRPGWPVSIEGIASAPVAATGIASVVVGSPHQDSSRILAFDRDGRSVMRSVALPVPATGDWTGAGGDDYPAPPILGPDGTTFLVSEGPGTTVYAVDKAGRVRPGWPYSAAVGLSYIGYVPPGEVGGGLTRSTPAVGPDGTLHVLHQPVDDGAGGSATAIGPDGKTQDGWPVTLRRPGSEFWSIVVASDGTAYALAIEPEGDAYSGTILAIAPDSTVRYAATIVEP